MNQENISNKTNSLLNKVNSLSFLVGTAECNAGCKHCAGIPLRKDAPKSDGIIDEDSINKLIRESYGLGARYISISSSGEPTLSPLSVTKLLKMIHGYESEGMKFSPINLYSNGIKIGEDENFCKDYLPLWKGYGLTTLYVTVHDIDEKKNAEVYGVEKYPLLEQVISRIHGADLKMRANIVLSQNTIHTFENFSSTVKYLLKLGVDTISAWPIRDIVKDKVDIINSPVTSEMERMTYWIVNNPQYPVKLLWERIEPAYKKNNKLSMLPNGTISDSWCSR